MKTTVLLSLAFISLSLYSRAQCDGFIIYQTKGEVNLLQGNASLPAQKNMKLTGDSRLMVGSDAAVILLSGKDKALRITTPGIFSLTEIRANCMKNQSSLTKEYLNYVAKSILETGEPLTAMVIKGAVYRTRTEFEKTAMILPADSAVVSAGPVTFTWHMGTPEVPKYLLIYENGVKNIYSKMLSDTTIALDDSLFKPHVIYFWLISDISTPSDKEPRFTFICGEPDWQNRFLEEWSAATMKELESQIDDLKQKMNKKNP
jgi:hypothetical protein